MSIILELLWSIIIILGIDKYGNFRSFNFYIRIISLWQKYLASIAKKSV